MRRVLFVSSAIVIACLVLTACGPGNGSPEGTAAPTTGDVTTDVEGTNDDVETPESTTVETPEPTTVRYIQASLSFATLPFYTASVMGYFEEEGILLEHLPDDPGTVPAVLAGEADVANAQTPSALNAIATDRPIVGLGLLLPTASSQVVLSNEAVERLAQDGVTVDSPIEDKAAALEGLSLTTYPEGTGVNQAVRIVANDAGFDPDSDMTINVVSDTTALIAQLREGRTDAIAFSPPISLVPVVEDFGTIWLNFWDWPSLEEAWALMAVVDESFAEENPEAVEGFLRAMHRGFETLRDQPDEVAPLIKGQYFGDMDQALFDAAFEVARPGFSAGMTPTQSGFETVLSQTSELSEQDLSGLTFDSVFDLSYLELATQ